MERIHKGLADAAHLAAGASRADAGIREAAEHRLAAIDKELAELRPAVMLDEAKSERFMKLTTERGTLSSVLSGEQSRPEPES